MSVNRAHEKLPSWVGWVGHMSTSREFLLNKSWRSAWGPVKGAQCFFRSLGMVAFANNPLSGILIYYAMIIGNKEVAFAAVLCWSIAAITSKMLNVPERQFCDGVPMFNSILVGCILVVSIPMLLQTTMTNRMWILMAVGASVTCFVDQGINIMLAPAHLPGQSLAFNIVGSLLFLSFKNICPHVPRQLDSIETNTTDTIDWNRAWNGVLLSAGEIYGLGTPQSAVLVWISLLIWSPVMTLMSVCGAIIGTVMGAYFAPAAIGDAYVGLFGFNALLGAAGFSYFVVPSLLGLLCVLVTAVITIYVQIAILPIFDLNLVPVFSFPFNVALMVTLSLCFQENPPIEFVGAPLFSEPTFPELNFYINSVSKAKKPQIRAHLEVELPLTDKLT